MKKKNYKCCGKSFKKINHEKFNNKCLICKKNTKKNKNLICTCDFNKNNAHKGLIRSLNTRYMDSESSNYSLCCKNLYEEIIEYYEERWNDYYSSRF